MNNQLHKAGLLVAVSIPLFILPARISEGQLNDPVNLIGSEIVIFLMSLTCWYSINFIQKKKSGWIGLALSLLACCFLSNVFYFTFNPIFKDFPFRTAQNPLFIKILMLSSRGVLMSVILIPAAYFLKRDQQVRFQRRENERLALEKVQIQNQLLEQAVQEQTAALREALASLEKAQHEIQHQLYVQSRLVASFTHDIGAPFNYLVLVAGKISELISEKGYDAAGHYSVELHKSLKTMLGFIQNLLEFAKLPVQQKLAALEKVNVANLIDQKSKLFEGAIRYHHNLLHIDCDPTIVVSSNPNLLGIVLHNLIDNANKHTSNGTIKVYAFVDNGVAQIVCENTGRPVPESVVRWLNSNVHSRNDTMVANEKQARSAASDTGIGLILVKEIASLLNIRLSMRSDLKATVVSLTFGV